MHINPKYRSGALLQATNGACGDAMNWGFPMRKAVIVRIGLLMSTFAALVLAGGASRGVR